MPEERSLDPRFDPRYQRGFDPATMPVEPETPARAGRGCRTGPAGEPGAGRDGARIASRLDDLDDDDDDEEFEPASTRNPFRLALLLVSIGLLVLAAATLWWTANNQNAYLFGSAVETPQNWMFQQLASVVPRPRSSPDSSDSAIWLGLGALAAKTAAKVGATDRREHSHGE